MRGVFRRSGHDGEFQNIRAGFLLEQEAADQFASSGVNFEFMVADNHLHAFLVSGVDEPAHHGGIAEKFNIDYIGTAFGEYPAVDFS